MSKISEEKKELLSFIDAIVTMLENASWDDFKLPDFKSLSLTINPFDFLLSIINKFVSYEEMIDWLTKFLTYVMPIVEVGVKGVLLTNLKQSIDCNNDPRIPEYLRGYGVDISLASIDYKNMLSVSPMSKEGRGVYFCASEDEIDNVYQLTRAQDMNAFLWFVINKARFVVDDDSYSGNPFFSYTETVRATNSSYSPGYVMRNQSYPNGTLLLCANVLSNSVNDLQGEKMVDSITSTRDITSIFWPIGNSMLGCNWYVNSGTYFQYLKTPSERVERNYDDDKAICQLTYKSALKGGQYDNAPVDVINFKILPKPLISVGSLSVGIETNDDNKKKLEFGIEPFKIMRFDRDGNLSSNGRYSFNSPQKNKLSNQNKTEFIINSESGATVTLEWNGGAVTMTDNAKYFLQECYPNLTVYEFNYDYVMGMQLFEPRVVATQLIENVCNAAFFGLNLSIDKTIYQTKISEVVKKIVESTEYTASDCFYTFSNDKFESMLHESEKKRSNSYEFNGSDTTDITLNIEEVYEVLSQFDDNAELVENQDTIKKSFLRASELLSNGVDDEDDKYNIKLGFVNNLISELVSVIIETLLTPKVILLLKVNQEIMGGSKDLSFEELLESLGGLIVAIVKEIRDLILQEILNWALEILKVLVEKLTALLLKEQVVYYTKLMTDLIKACSFRLKGGLVDVKLDNVDYADIDPPTEQPVNNEC